MQADDQDPDDLSLDLSFFRSPVHADGKREDSQGGGGVAAVPCFPQEKDLVDDTIGGFRLLSDGFRGMLAGETALIAAACWLFTTIACAWAAGGGRTLQYARASSVLGLFLAMFVPVLAGWDVVRYGFWVWLGGFVAANRGAVCLIEQNRPTVQNARNLQAKNAVRVGKTAIILSSGFIAQAVATVVLYRFRVVSQCWWADSDFVLFGAPFVLGAACSQAALWPWARGGSVLARRAVLGVVLAGTCVAGAVGITLAMNLYGS